MATGVAGAGEETLAATLFFFFAGVVVFAALLLFGFIVEGAGLLTVTLELAALPLSGVAGVRIVGVAAVGVLLFAPLVLLALFEAILEGVLTEVAALDVALLRLEAAFSFGAFSALPGCVALALWVDTGVAEPDAVATETSR